VIGKRVKIVSLALLEFEFIRGYEIIQIAKKGIRHYSSKGKTKEKNRLLLLSP
jgi:hypothetical protein